jgi:hypothetical protein
MRIHELPRLRPYMKGGGTYQHHVSSHSTLPFIVYFVNVSGVIDLPHQPSSWWVTTASGIVMARSPQSSALVAMGGKVIVRPGALTLENKEKFSPSRVIACTFPQDRSSRKASGADATTPAESQWRNLSVLPGMSYTRYQLNGRTTNITADERENALLILTAEKANYSVVHPDGGGESGELKPGTIVFLDPHETCRLEAQELIYDRVLISSARQPVPVQRHS